MLQSQKSRSNSKFSDSTDLFICYWRTLWLGVSSLCTGLISSLSTEDYTGLNTDGDAFYYFFSKENVTDFLEPPEFYFYFLFARLETKAFLELMLS